MKKNVIKPTGLKGKEITNRVKYLMEYNNVSSDEDTSNPIGLTKIGPDGKIYAIVRENQEFYIKIANRREGILVIEDFQYIGGLKNKKSEAYPTYEKAIKQLNLKFHSINESLNLKGSYNVFKTDNLLGEEMGMALGVAGFGFESVVEEEDVVEEEVVDEDVELSEAEQAIEEIINPTPVVEVELSEAEKAIESMIDEDAKGMSMVEAITNEEDDSELNEDAKSYLSTLSEDQILSLYNDLKKKV